MAHPDTLLRIALSVYLTALDSGLTPAQEGWLRTRLQSRDPLSALERQRLKGPLLAWCARHGTHEKIAAAFEEEHVLRT